MDGIEENQKTKSEPPKENNMKMHHFVIALLLGGLVVLSGCDQGTSGGPGVTDPPTRDRITQSDNTFSMNVPNVSLNQGETETITIGISRGDNFNEDVSLSFASLPTGVTIVSEDPTIKRSDTDLDVTFRAARDAALGDFTIEVTGQPTSGAPAKSEMKLTIGELDTADTATQQPPQQQQQPLQQQQPPQQP